MSAFIQSLYIYPIKSCQGISYDRLELVKTGFKYDRHWMLVDKNGHFLSQRQHPDMARIKTSITTDSLVVSNSSISTQLEIPLSTTEFASGKNITVKIWNDHCSASLVSADASLWFSNFLGIDCDLVYLADSEQRLVDPDYASKKEQLGFADGFPLLIMSRSTIDLLNDKLTEKVNINRFRANIIIDGCDAHAEDLWSKITVNHIDILLAKPCSRCVIPRIDQQSAEKHTSLLKTLASYRRMNGKVYVGQNGLHQSNGLISVGLPVSVQLK